MAVTPFYVKYFRYFSQHHSILILFLLNTLLCILYYYQLPRELMFNYLIFSLTDEFFLQLILIPTRQKQSQFYQIASKKSSQNLPFFFKIYHRHLHFFPLESLGDLKNLLLLFFLIILQLLNPLNYFRLGFLH